MAQAPILVFACLAPHPPIILPNVGSPTDRIKVKKTIAALEKLAQELADAKPEAVIISSPHPDWGFNVPLHFLTKTLSQIKVKTYLTNLDSPQEHFSRGQQLSKSLPRAKRWAWIASGDMSHRLAKDGPYGLHPSGAKFDQKFLRLLEKKDIPGILSLDPHLVEEAAECGLRSFCLLLGAIKKERLNWQPKILSYEAPFGVGYLVARLI
jgi:aromatic ring-opening dioxygenase LigB subunit